MNATDFAFTIILTAIDPILEQGPFRLASKSVLRPPVQLPFSPPGLLHDENRELLIDSSADRIGPRQAG